MAQFPKLETRSLIDRDGETFTVTTGSGNVFADLGLPDAEELLYKSQLALEIRRVIKARKLTQTAAARLAGIGQPDLSKLLGGRLDGFTVERLFNLLNRLGHRVEVRVIAEPTTPEEARTLVLMA